MLLGERFPTFLKQYSAFVLKGLAGIENSQLFIQDVGNDSFSDAASHSRRPVHYWNCNLKCVCAGTEDGGLDSSLMGSQESLYAAEDSSMELEYSSSDKVPKTLKHIIRYDIRLSHFFMMVFCQYFCFMWVGAQKSSFPYMFPGSFFVDFFASSFLSFCMLLYLA